MNDTSEHDLIELNLEYNPNLTADKVVRLTKRSLKLKVIRIFDITDPVYLDQGIATVPHHGILTLNIESSPEFKVPLRNAENQH